MGKKSDKKVKSDRINVLRTKYDTFLEEDKKRKERNDYILGRLDKMRYCAVQAQHKPILYGEVIPIQNRGGAYLPEHLERREFQTKPPERQLNHPPTQNLHMDVPRNFSDLSTLLKEISNKYILIPKLRTTMTNDYVGMFRPQSPATAAPVSSHQTNIASNEDWKSKYDILEKLKKNENEEQTDKYGNDELYPVKENETLSKDGKKHIFKFSSKKDIDDCKPQDSGDDYALQGYNSKEYTTKYEHEVAEKDLTSDKVKAETESQNIERTKISDSKDQEQTADQTANISASAYATHMNTVYDDHKLQDQNLDNYVSVEGAQTTTDQNVFDSNYPNENLVASEYTEDNVTNKTEHQIKDVPHTEQYPLHYEQPVEIEGNYPDYNNAYVDPGDYSPIEVLDTPALVEQIHYEPNITNIIPDAIHDEKHDEAAYQYPVEMLNVQEFTPKEDVELKDGENVNPVYTANDENIEPVNEFVHAETDENQQYMASEENVEPIPQSETTIADPQYSAGIETFDAEQREMFYSEEKPEYNYDQQQVDTSNQDHANEPVQDNTYYESPAALQEQEYPVEINEHEESNARYDQNYEQQYATEYEGYVQPGYDENTQQQYVYDQTEQPYQNYEYTQPDNDNAENIQQVLDQDAGYVAQQNYIPEEDPQVQPGAGQEAV